MGYEFVEVDVLRDVTYNTHINDVRFTPEVMVSTGAYKPSIKIHLLEQHSLKNERMTDNEATRIVPLTDDGLKLGLLRTDRFVDIHAKYGHHASFRLPYFADDMIYNKVNCDLIFLGTKGMPVFTLDEGRFSGVVSDLKYEAFALSPTNALLACARSFHTDFFDFRSKKKVVSLNKPANISLDFNLDGYHFTCCTNDSLSVYDLRVHAPLSVASISFRAELVRYNDDFICLGGDSGISLFDSKSGLNSPCAHLKFPNLVRFDFDAGLFAVVSSNENKIKTYFCKGLGAVPKWCDSLDNDA